METQADSLLNQLSQKVMRVLRKAESKADRQPEVREKLNELEALWGVEPKICISICIKSARSKPPCF